MNRANANKHIWTCLSPQEYMWHLSSWTPSIWDPWEILSTWVFSPPGDLFLPLRRWYILWCDLSLNDKLWCDLSLPLWHQFPRRVWSLSHNTKHLYKWDACRGQDSLSGAGSEETQNKWQTIFPVVKSVAPSGMLRLYRMDSVGPKTTNRWNRVHHRENTCHLSSLD